MRHTAADPTPSRIAAALAAHGVTQAELARFLGVSHNYVRRRITLGEVPFRITELQAIAGHLDVPVGDLINGEPS